MQHKQLIAALALAFSGPLAAEPDALSVQFSDLKAQIIQMRADYEKRIATLEEKLENAQARLDAQAETLSSGPSAGMTSSATAPSARTAPSAGTASARTGAFNPEISLILQGAYKQRKKVEEGGIRGFVASGHTHEDGHEGDKRGFTLDHTELTLAANLDDTYRGQATLALIDGETELEEAWFQTLGLGKGLGLKAGRFLSGIGYQNEQHAHQWDFYELPLMYGVLFGEHGYTHDGVQAKWVAPTELFLEVGAEAGRGQNFPGSDRNHNGIGSHALFAHVGGDIGLAHSWRAGISHLSAKADARESHFESDPYGEVHGAFSGKSRVWIADFVYKWAPAGNVRNRNFKFQAEYFRRTEKGRLAAEEESGRDLGESAYETRQSGYYLQGVYQFSPNWRAGLRYDRLDSGRQRLGDNPAEIEITNANPRRVAFMVDYSWSEFSRLRLQFARDRALRDVTGNQVTLQYIMSLGSHGAHKF
jgi:hypothetical protein